MPGRFSDADPILFDPSIGVLWGYGDVMELTSAGADAVATTPAELLGQLSP